MTGAPSVRPSFSAPSTDCCDIYKYVCPDFVPICPSSSFTSKPINPTKGPMYSAKPSQILVRPTQLVNIDALVTSLPKPSWPIKNPVNLTALGMRRPDSIVSKLNFASANYTEISKPAKIQELVVHIACTFRMPLENIRITNITILSSLGKITIVQFDVANTNLNSSGRVVCLPSRTRLRSLQQTTSGGGGDNVNIEYAILDPSDEILSLDDSEFQTVVASSSLTTFESSLITSQNAPSSPSSSSQTGSIDENTVSVRIGVGVGLGVTGFAILVAVGMLIRNKQVSRRRRITNSVHVTYTQSPIQFTASKYEPFSMRVLSSDRQSFNPVGSRGSRGSQV